MWGALRRVGALRARYRINIVATRGQYNRRSPAVPGRPGAMAADTTH